MAYLAFKRSVRGKLTFSRDPVTREYLRDSRAVYPVLATVVMQKGGYYFDSTGQAGTLLYTVKNDRLTTGSRLVAYASDGMKQVEDAGLISNGSVSAEKVRTGSWRLNLRWRTAEGQQTQFLGVG